MRNAELTLREFLVAVLHRLRMILLIALAGAVLSGAFAAYTTRLGISAQQEQYDIRLAAYEQTLSSKRASLQDSRAIAAQAREYNQNSLLMRVDPYKKQVAKLSFSVSVSPDVATDVGLPQGQTLSVTDLQAGAVRDTTNRYLLLAASMNLGSVLGAVNAAGAAEDYLRELVRVREFDANTQDDTGAAQTGIIVITVTGAQGLDAKAASEAIYASLLSQKPLVEQSTVPHALIVLDENVQTVIDNSLAEHQKRQRALLSDNASSVIQLQQEIYDLQDQRPRAPSLIISVAQGAALGFLLGMVLGIGLAVLMYLTRLPIHYATQAERQLGMRFLGGAMPPRKGLFPGIRNRLAAESLLAPSPQAAALVAVNLEQAAGQARRILLTGTLPASDLAALAQGIQAHIPADTLTIVPAGDITTDAQSARELAMSDAVVLAERLHASRLRQIQGVRDRAQASCKPVLGYVLF